MAMHGPPMGHQWVKFGSKKAFLMVHRWGRKTDMSEKFELHRKLCYGLYLGIRQSIPDTFLTF